MANVTPIHKKGPRTTTGNYRPVSILPNMSKIYKKCIHEQLFSYFETILLKYQCGFRKGYSAQHCLIVMLEKWRTALDNNGTFGALLTDLSKAFDCLIHDLLIAKLHAYGIDNNSLRFIHDYLTNRKQRVKINSSLQLVAGYNLWSSARIDIGATAI